jgi:hypothetical protein
MLIYYLENKYDHNNSMIKIHDSIIHLILALSVRAFVDMKDYPKLAKLNVQLFSLWLY